MAKGDREVASADDKATGGYDGELDPDDPNGKKRSAKQTKQQASKKIKKALKETASIASVSVDDEDALFSSVRVMLDNAAAGVTKEALCAGCNNLHKVLLSSPPAAYVDGHSAESTSVHLESLMGPGFEVCVCERERDIVAKAYIELLAMILMAARALLRAYPGSRRDVASAVRSLSDQYCSSDGHLSLWVSQSLSI